MDTNKALFPILEYHPVPTDWVYVFNVRSASGEPDYSSCLYSLVFPAYDGPKVSQRFTGYLVFNDEDAALEWFTLACETGLFSPTDRIVRNMLMWHDVPAFINTIRTRYRRRNPFTNTRISGVVMYSTVPLFYNHGVPVYCDLINL
ncbi:hypothetical protein [Microcystis phage Mvi-JY20]|uniref:Uncharacterized protein n=1 Tax=Microcystis phage Mvi-JY20 TaxID=3128146 RepID=A0AAX4QGF2_9CAUD